MDTHQMHIDGQANIPNSDAKDADSMDALRVEVAKWQERVPKLALALRERTEELASVRQELRTAQSAGANIADPGGQVDDARLEARDQLIEELQHKVTQLAERHRTAASELHATQLDLESTSEDAKGWQDKWQRVTASLDESISSASRSSSEWALTKQAWKEQEQELARTHEEALKRVHADVESLRTRNGKQQETIDFANKQIEILGEDLALCVEQVEQGKAAEGALGERLVEEEQRYVVAMQAADEEQTQLSQQLDAKDEAAVEVNKQLEALTLTNDSERKEMQELRQRQDDVNRQLEDGMELTRTQRSQIETFEREQARLTHAVDDSHRCVAESEARIAAVNEDMQTLTRHAESLQEDLDRASSACADTTEQAAVDANNAAEQIHALNTALAETQSQREQLEQNQSGQSAELTEMRAEHEQSLANEQALRTQIDQIADAGEQKQRDLDEEISRLGDCVGQAQDSNEQGEGERRELAERVAVLEDENHKLKTNLQERSTLVCELEDERRDATDSRSATAAEHTQLTGQLTEAQHRIETFQDHAQSLEDKRVTQQDLISALEDELREVQVESTTAFKAAEHGRRSAEDASRKTTGQLKRVQDRNGKLLTQAKAMDADVEALMAELGREQDARKDQQNAVHTLQAEQHQATEAHALEITRLKGQLQETEQPEKQAAKSGSGSPGQLRELEQLLRERTEELDNLRWRQEQQQTSPDDNLVMILNQQLSDAVQENKRLNNKIVNAGGTVNEGRETADDLTVLKGVGEKLAEQLCALGFTRLQQIADLDAKTLAQEDHVLYGFKSRIERDDWITQARKACSKAP